MALRDVIGLPPWVAGALAAAVLAGPPPAAEPSASAFLAGGPLPWETWLDLHRLAELPAGTQGLLRSSHCPDGCRFDRHSAGDWRYVYVDGEEGVIFEEAGAGAITRIWMTMRDELDRDIQLRIYVDGDPTPVIDLPLPALFDGSTPPFVPPLAGDRPMSSGGYFSYVPIPYRDGCRVVLVGADDKRLWFQLNFHRLADAESVTSFTGDEDLSALADLLSAHGMDPWPAGSGAVTTGAETLAAGEARPLLALPGPGTLTALKLTAEPARWPEIELRLTFDGGPAVRMPLADFFAVGRIGSEPTRSLLVGVDGETLYSYFPMPFFAAAEVALMNGGATPAAVDWEVRSEAVAPSPESGLFGAELSHTAATDTGVDFPLVSLAGHGKLAGSFIELGSTAGESYGYLEGDERLFIDGSPHPAVYGTGVEDFFNGGFYFDQGPFSQALHGAPYTELAVEGLPTTAAYRLMLTDGITFENRLVAGLESGPTGDVSMRARAVTWFYRQRPARLHLWDRFDVGSESDRLRHHYEVEGPHVFEELTALFEGEPPAAATGTGVYRFPGTASFVFRPHPTSQYLRLRRRLDAGFGGQRATILLDGEVAGFFPPVDVNADRRWREIDVDLGPLDGSGAEVTLTVVAEAGPPAGDDDIFTAFRYELWADGEAEIFADGFESGDLSAWTAP